MSLDRIAAQLADACAILRESNDADALIQRKREKDAKMALSNASLRDSVKVARAILKDRGISPDLIPPYKTCERDE